MYTEERIIAGIPAWLMGEYLQKIGMVDEGNGRYTTPTITARVEQIEDHQIASLRVGQIRFLLEGEETAVKTLKIALERKLLRGGG